MTTRSISRSFAIGAITGLRSMTGLAVTRWAANDPIRLAFAGLAAGELLADKLPAIPARTSPPALLFRVLAGGFAGALLDRSADADRAAGAVAGAAGAVAAAFAGIALRRAVVRWTHLPDPLVALGEDAIAVAGTVALVRV